MSETPIIVRNISDTARWAAVFRARETERPDALFRDPFAARLAGRLGVDIANTLPDGNKHAWAWVARTYWFDQFIEREIQLGADMVLNLAAGLDARPYRMQLPKTLQWIEIDLPQILSYKEKILAGEHAACPLERIPLDLADVRARRAVFTELQQRAKRIVVLTEGLVIYLDREEVISLSKDLAAHAQFQRWIVDLHSPGLLHIMKRTTGKQLKEVGAAFKFAPAEGADFFLPYGWRAVEVQGLITTAAKFKRLAFGLRLFSRLPESGGRLDWRPWSGVCLLGRTA
jgi:methyltransferase (TIGR00027 family)